jgi:hypothetical protein
MIEVQLKKREDFIRLARNQKTVYFKENCEGFIYYIISEQSGVGLIHVFKSGVPLKFKEDFEPEKIEEIPIDFLIDIEK